MAKKKADKTEKDIEDELEDDLLDGEEIETVYPDVDDKKEKPDDSTIDESVDDEEEEDFEEEEEEPRFPEYKYVDLNLIKGPGENDYELMLDGQTHGFCNILVKHLLEIEGVNMAAYKVTGIEPSTIYIRLENLKDYSIKDILYKGIESLREGVVEAQKLFQKLM